MAQTLFAGAPATGIDGFVRATEDGRGMGGVVVEIIEARRWTVTDSLGHYSIESLSPGDHRVRFRAPGRVTLEVTASISLSTTVRLDIELSAKPVELPPLVAVAATNQADRHTESSGKPRPEPLDLAWALRAVPGREDISSALLIEPAAALRGEEGGTLHLGGGDANQVSVTVDGFPVYGATHFGAAWSALNPDLVRDLAVRSASTTVEDEGRLSGTVAVRTSLLGGDEARARGTASPSDVRQLFRGELGGGRARFLVSGRRSIRNFFVDGAPIDGQNGYDDWLATIALSVGGGRLRALSFRGNNQLSFESLADTLAGSSTSISNNVEWAAHTDGLAWEVEDSTRRISVMAWRAGTGAGVDWRDPNRPVGLHSRFDEFGLRAQETWSGPWGATTVGVGVKRVETGYRANPVASAGGALTIFPTLQISSAPTLLSAFARRQWQWGEPLRLDASVRAASTTSGWTGLEPRLSVQLRPSQNLALTLRAGRVHQLTQSFSNDETFLSTLLALEMPAAVGITGVPVAWADNLEAELVARTGTGLTFALDGYTRRLGNLVLAAPSSHQPFASTVVGVGSGKAGGLIARVGFARGPLELAAEAGIARASRTLGAVTYIPGFQRPRFVHAALLVRPDASTTLGLGLTASNGQLTTPVTSVDWRPNDPLSGNGELAGTPTNIAGPINTNRLPALRRLDIGLRREWRFKNWPAGRRLTTSLRIQNLLNHPNALGLIGTRDPRRRALLPAGGRTVGLELGWAF